MPATKLAATSVSDFVMSGSAVAADVITLAANLAPYALEGFDATDGRVFTRDIDEPFTDFWFRCHVTCAANHLNELLFFDTAFSTSQAVLRVIGSAGVGNAWSGQLLFQAWNGAAWSTLTTTTNVLGNTILKKVDIQYVRSNTVGIVRIYFDDALEAEVTATDTDLAAWTTIDRVRIQAASSTGADAWIFSGVIISTDDTRQMKFVQESITGNGANTAWTGDYTGIDELGLNTADEISSTTTNDVETFTGAINNIIDTGHDILASVLTFNVNSVGGDSDLAAAYRISGTNYEATPKTAPSGPSIMAFVTEVSPATATAWTAAEIEGAEFGVANKT